jgi:hypothetical protein
VRTRSKSVPKFDGSEGNLTSTKLAGRGAKGRTANMLPHTKWRAVASMPHGAKKIRRRAIDKKKAAIVTSSIEHKQKLHNWAATL